MKKHKIVRLSIRGIHAVTWQCKNCGFAGTSAYENCPRCGAKYR